MGADIYDWDRVHGKGSYARLAENSEKAYDRLRAANPPPAAAAADELLAWARSLDAPGLRVDAIDIPGHGRMIVTAGRKSGVITQFSATSAQVTIDCDFGYPRHIEGRPVADFHGVFPAGLPFVALTALVEGLLAAGAEEEGQHPDDHSFTDPAM
jgi:hypothetical protein